MPGKAVAPVANVIQTLDGNLKRYMSSKLQSDKDDKNYHYTQTLIYKAFAPFLNSLKVAGLYYVKDGTSRNECFTKFQKIYSFIVTITIFVAFVLHLVAFKDATGINPNSFSIFTVAIFYCQCAANVFCFLIASHNPLAFNKFFTCLSNLDKYGGMYTPLKQIKKLITFLCVLCWIIFVVIVIISGYMMFSVTLLGSMIPQTFFASDSSAYFVVQIVSAIFNFFLMTSWIFSNCLELLVGILIYNECKLYCSKSLFIKQNDNSKNLQPSFENERKRFVEMTRIIRAADCLVSFRHATSFGCNVINICVLLYIISYYPAVVQNHAIVGSYLLWLIVCVLDIGVICCSGMLVIRGVSISVIFIDAQTNSIHQSTRDIIKFIVLKIVFAFNKQVQYMILIKFYLLLINL